MRATFSFQHLFAFKLRLLARYQSAALSLLFMGCLGCTPPDPTPSPTPTSTPADDVDGDGFAEESLNGQMLDCDDNNPNAYPGAPEVCDGTDSNCNGEVDEGFDVDEDGHNDQSLCPKGDDCDDSSPEINPEIAEVCNLIDDNCNGNIDEGFDRDYDEVSQCALIPDCDDREEDTYPGAPELCDDLDNDCDGAPSEQELDRDGDGLTPCDGDCDDSDPIINLNGVEVCNAKDDDCDNLVDEDLDHDLDTYLPCGPLADCDDTNATRYPGAEELCDGLDNDCDQTIPDDEQDSDQDSLLNCADQDDDGDGVSDVDDGVPLDAHCTEVLYGPADFSGSLESPEFAAWSPISGQWHFDLENGLYVNESAGVAELTWLGPQDWQPSVIETQLSFNPWEGSVPEPPLSGLLLMAQPDTTEPTATRAPSAYLFASLNRATGATQLYRVGTSTELLAESSTVVDVDRTQHTLRVESKDGHHRVFTDGLLSLEVDDATYSSGSIGLRTDASPSSFDAVLVCR